MARIEDIERRLLNWARWRRGAGSGGLGYSTVNLAGDGGRSGYRESTVPTLSCEAEETDQAVRALDSVLRRTVEVFYLDNSGVVQHARRLACSERTVYARVCVAHLHIRAWLSEREQARRVHRERVEALQRMARP